MTLYDLHASLTACPVPARAAAAPGGGDTFRVVVAGGGAGHCAYPVLATVRALRAWLAVDRRVLDVVWAGQAASLEEQLAAADGIPFRPVPASGPPLSRNPLRFLARDGWRNLGRAVAAFRASRRLIRETAPDAVLTCGGPAAVPAGLAAWSLRRPLVVYQQDPSRAGILGRALARAATCAAVPSSSAMAGLPRRARRFGMVTGLPVRQDLLGSDASCAADALNWPGYIPRLPVVYVTGGTSGAPHLNETVAGILPWLLSCANVICQCGDDGVEPAVRQAGALPSGYAAGCMIRGTIGPELPAVLARADIVVTAGGPGTLAEITALGKPAVLIPPPGTGELPDAARRLTGNNAILALPDGAGPGELRRALALLLDSPGRRADLARHARELGRPAAAADLAETVLAAPRQRASARRARPAARIWA